MRLTLARNTAAETKSSSALIQGEAGSWFCLPGLDVHLVGPVSAVLSDSHWIGFAYG